MLTREVIAPYLQKELPEYRFKADSLAIAEDLQIHSKGNLPVKILETVRPNEEPQYKQYRLDVYKPVTKTYFSKVLTTISKIGRAEDWKIAYNEKIKENPLQSYMEKDYPYFDSFSNYFFSYVLQAMCDDPNGVLATMLLDMPQSDAEFVNPHGVVFSSAQKIEFIENGLAVLLDTKKSPLQSGESEVLEGRILHIFDRDQYMKLVQVGYVNDEVLSFEQTVIDHNIGYMPVVSLGGIVKQFEEGQFLYDSFLSACLPFWQEAVARYSDHQVNMVLHLHPDQWEIADTPCPVKSCKDGVVSERDFRGVLQQGQCKTCHGTGKIVTRTPFGRRILNAGVQNGVNNVTPMPTPPAGYVDRPIESISFLKQEYQDNIKAGLQAINLEWLMNEPEINSGVAKSLDRQEMNTYFYTIARHVVENIFKPHYYFVDKWRFGKVSGHERLLPEIAIPQKFDVLTSDVAAQRLALAIKEKFSPAIINKLQYEYAKKDGNEKEASLLEITQRLDPLPYLTPEEKNNLIVNSSNMGTSYIKYVISCNLPAYINRALFEKPNFLSLSYSEQIKLMKAYAEEDIKDNEGQVVPLVNANTFVNGQQATGNTQTA